MRYKALLTAVAVCTAFGSSFAAPVDMVSTAQMGQDRVCEADVLKVCSEIYMPRPGDDRVLLCLEKHVAQLTDNCKRNVATCKNRIGSKRERY